MFGERRELVVLSSLPFAVGAVLTAVYGMEATIYVLTGVGVLVVSLVAAVGGRTGTRDRHGGIDRPTSGPVARNRQDAVGPTTLDDRPVYACVPPGIRRAPVPRLPAPARGCDRRGGAL